jgi:type IV secretory pathway TraG/TraD family ATPase VirD4
MSGTLKTKFVIPQNRIAELVATTLPQSGWKVVQFNQDVNTCTAERKVDKGGGQGQPDTYSFTAVIDWVADKEASDTYRIKVTVTEDNNKTSEDECKSLAADFFRTCKRLEQKMQENPLKERITYGSAHWANIDDLRKASYVIAKEDLNPQSFLIGRADEEQVIASPPELAIRHTLVCGATGTGKTTGFILPQAINRLKTSAIFTEATDGSKAPAVYSQSAGWRAEKGGQDIYYFNPDDVASNQMNLVEMIRTAEQAAAIASLIIRNTSAKITDATDFWARAEQYLLNALLIHAAGFGGDLAFVRQLVQKGPFPLGEVLSQSVYQKARDEYQGFLSVGSEVTRSNVFIGLLNRLQAWTYPVVQKVTERNDVDWMSLRDKLFSFYIAVPAAKDDLKPVVSLVLNFLLEEVADVKEDSNRPSPLKHPLMLILDEFANFGRIAGFENKISIIRHREIGVMLGVQALSQLSDTYGQDCARAIMNNLNTRIYLRPIDEITAETISKALGQKTHYERKVNSSGALVETEVAVPLMSMGDVLSLDKSKAVLFTPATAPLKIDFFQWADFKDAYQLSPPERRKLEVQRELVKAGESTAAASQDVQKEKEREHSIDEPAPDF